MVLLGGGAAWDIPRVRWWRKCTSARCKVLLGGGTAWYCLAKALRSLNAAQGVSRVGLGMLHERSARQIPCFSTAWGGCCLWTVRHPAEHTACPRPDIPCPSPYASDFLMALLRDLVAVRRPAKHTACPHLPCPSPSAGDFLMALLRDLVVVRRAAGRPLKVVLMSATLDSSLFAGYFGGGAGAGAGVGAGASGAAGAAGGGGGGGCPVLHAEGRTFPVEQLFLEDAYELTGKAVLGVWHLVFCVCLAREGVMDIRSGYP
jgi:hypothetical protein